MPTLTQTTEVRPEAENPEQSRDHRWPHWVFATGDEPDPRRSLSNENTFLAWARMAIGLIASGIAIAAVNLPVPDGTQTLMSGLLLLCGAFMAPAAWLSRCLTERALRLGKALPNTLPAELALALVITAVVGIFAYGYWIL